jgi:hypothetical protein
MIKSILEESAAGGFLVIDDFSNVSNFKNSTAKEKSTDYKNYPLGAFNYEQKSVEKQSYN